MPNEVRAAIWRARNKSEVWYKELKTFQRGYAEFFKALADEDAVMEMMARRGYEELGQETRWEDQGQQDIEILMRQQRAALRALAEACEP